MQQELQKEKFDLEGEVKKYLSKAEGQTVSDATHVPMTEQEVQCIIDKYEKHFPKMYGDVGMAVPKTTQTRYMDGSVQATQMTTQVTPSLHHFSFLSSAQSSFQYSDNKA